MNLNRVFRIWCVLALILVATSSQGVAQTAQQAEVDELRQMVRELSARVAALEAERRQHQHGVETATPTTAPQAVVASAAPETTVVASSSVAPSTEPKPVAEARVASTLPNPPTQSVASQPDKVNVVPATLPGGTTLNYFFDGYYGYDFNHPIGRVQYLRAYDVLSNAFSVNQTGIILALDPSVEEGRRYGVRLDLQFGQATETTQGNPANEPRPDIYRNIFQAYGTYVFPLGKGLTVDVGKWSSSIGIEGTYAKDQMNYSRSFLFGFLPFYHAGVRANYKVNDKLGLNYWLVNGTQQSEPTNSYKDEMFGLALQPRSNLSWTVNYYNGQDHPDSAPATDCATAPIQNGLCLKAISPAPDGKQHIFDTYATWNVTRKTTLAIEGDYVISRQWAKAASGQSSAPSHVVGGAAYARYQWTKQSAFAGRTEYLADRDGLFSGTSQALKEFTGTYEYKVADGLLTRLEYRRDWSNLPFFLTNKPGVLSPHQDTFTVGMVWWYGGKRGAW
ncbi:outer membrane beta-barrel protein [Edaphobacter flagellatus]|uniref:outer membrane beta-barrel protein n=1 Tax=Edaphobacter flagellatus TaxID=1933044 RepID=UPI0021B1DE9D|nr:outer membrane beta-barrel protein [Edaphobacter flagellatus]